MKSSIGYHTFSLYRKLTLKEAVQLYKAFTDYNAIEIHPNKRNMIIPRTENKDPFFLTFSNYHYINYTEQGKGISWILRVSVSSPHFKDKSSDEHKSCSIKVTINPKLFTGIKDYVTAASEKNLRDVERNFNLEAGRISSILGEFNSYLLNRIDYCFNVDAEELGLGCTTKQLMALIKRSNIPPHFEERQEYDPVSHRMKTDKNTFYLQSKSVTTNCYSKHYQLSKNFPDCPNIEDALHVIRFEIQCKYLKVYNMLKNIKGFIEHDNVALLQEMLSDRTAQEVIEKYFNRVIRKGHYYPLETAKRLIRARNFSEKKEDRLINALVLINRCRSITMAKSAFKGIELEEFKRSIRELESIGINPVTIPKEWKINYIPNLLFAYEMAVARGGKQEKGGGIFMG